MGFGPYEVPNIAMDCYGAYTNNPPCGAMRGFGSVQTAFAVEAMMDKLADAVGLDPVEIRVRNGYHEGSRAPTGQVIDSAAPVAELVQRLQAMPLPSAGTTRHRSQGDAGRGLEHHPRRGRTSRRGLRGRLQERRVLRGLRRLLHRPGPARGRRRPTRWPPCTPPRPRSARDWSPSSSRSAAPSSASTQVVVAPKDTQVGSAGSSSASRQTYVTGGAVKAACESVRAARPRPGRPARSGRR